MAGFSGVVDDLYTRADEPSRETRKSVNVPPTSTPTLNFIVGLRIRSIGGQALADERHARRTRDAPLCIEVAIAAAHQRQVPLTRHDVEPEGGVPAIIRDSRLVETPRLR